MRSRTQAFDVLYGFDPGPRTGVAWYSPQSGEVHLGGVVSPEGLLPYLDGVLRKRGAARIAFIVEDWENYGRKPGFRANLPNRLIGVIEGYAHAVGVPVHLYPPSKWKRAFAKNVSPITFSGLERRDRVILARLVIECGDRVLAQAEEMPMEDLPHTLDAAGLAVYSAFALGLR